MRRAVLPCLILFSLLTTFLAPAGAASADDIAAANPAIVVNEIHYAPADKRAQLEFVELFNPSPQAVDLSGWAFTAGITYQFAPGVLLGPGRYLVVAANPQSLQQRYGGEALGPFAGSLDNEGEALVLRDNQANVVDSVEYGIGFPWPIGGGDYDLSIGLMNAALDNSIPGAWRANYVSPGRRNDVWVDNPPPFIDAVEHLPAAPTAFDAVQIRARVTDADGVASVRVLLQDVAPGSYIRLTDSAYATQWTPVDMHPIGDDLYAAEVPAYMRVHRHLIRYRVEATDRAGRRVQTPYVEDPQPNFALYIYNGVPAWGGAISPGAPNNKGIWNLHDFNQMRPLAVYQLLAVESDVEDAQHIPDSLMPGYMGNDYPWFGTLVYNGAIYDHISFRARGGARRYATGKNNWKFNFRRGHRFQAYDDYGVPYPVKWDKLVFSSVLQHANRRLRGEQGMFEAISYRLFNLVGVPASDTHFVHFRVVDQPAEQTGNQYAGDFWGLYLAIEDVDGQFLDRHNLPDGNLYEMKASTGELDNEGENAVADASDLYAFINTYLYGAPDVNWWRANFDLSRYFSFRSITEAIHNYDIWEGKNYYYYLNPETNIWTMLPWDLDVTWAEWMSGSGEEPFFTPVLRQPVFQVEYQNRLREIRDLLFNPDQIFPMLDEIAAIIDSPVNGLSMVDADRAMWDYNPILDSDYVIKERGLTGEFYRIAPHGDFRGMVQVMRNYTISRATWIDEELLTDREAPYTPGVWYGGPTGFPADQLVFDASGFGDPQGAHTFAAMQWRVAELSYPGIPGYNYTERGRYEIEATWLSNELTSYQSRVTLPPGACTPGATCRVRVRMKDTSGRWSHWSAPVQFVAGQPAPQAAQGLVISELMYNPLHAGAVPSEELEFVELRNSGTTTIDLSGAHFTQGIDYTFPRGASLAPGRFLVLASDAQAFAGQYGFAPYDAFGGALKNSGEQLALVDVLGRPLLDMTYADAEPWDSAADGEGYSLVLRSAASTNGWTNPANWRASQGVGGSPGADDPDAVLINEVIFNRSSGRITQVEFYNPGSEPAQIGNWLLTLAPMGADWRWQALPAGMRIAATAQVPPGGYLAVPVSTQLALDSSDRWTLSLLSLSENRPSGFRTEATLQAPAFGSTVGRTAAANSDSLLAPLRSATPGGPNAGALVGPVVISRLRIFPGDSTQWIELTNLSSQAVPLYAPDHPEQTWMIAGALFSLPSGITLPPGGKLLISGSAPETLCTTGAATAGVRVTGPFALPLSEAGLDLQLLRPIPWGASRWTYAVADMVEMGAGAPLPGELRPILQRNPPDGFGSDVGNWQAVAPAEPTGNAAGAGQLCLFEAVASGGNRNEVRWMLVHDATIRQFIVSSSDAARSIPTTATIPVDPAAESGELTTYIWDDASTVGPDDERFYWLEAEHLDGSLQELSFTTPVTIFRLVRLPLVER